MFPSSVIGIDPGQRGAIALMRHDGQLIEMSLMPKCAADIRVYLRELKERAYDWDRGVPAKVIIEQPFAVRGHAACAALSQGTHYGELRGILVCLDFDWLAVLPRKWQSVVYKGLQLSGTAKEKALQASGIFFQSVSFVAPGARKGTKPHDGLVDAALIAEYGRRLMLAGGFQK